MRACVLVLFVCACVGACVLFVVTYPNSLTCTHGGTYTYILRTGLSLNCKASPKNEFISIGNFGTMSEIHWLACMLVRLCVCSCVCACACVLYMCV